MWNRYPFDYCAASSSKEHSVRGPLYLKRICSTHIRFFFFITTYRVRPRILITNNKTGISKSEGHEREKRRDWEFRAGVVIHVMRSLRDRTSRIWRVGKCARTTAERKHARAQPTTTPPREGWKGRGLCTGSCIALRYQGKVESRRAGVRARCVCVQVLYRAQGEKTFFSPDVSPAEKSPDLYVQPPDVLFAICVCSFMKTHYCRIAPRFPGNDCHLAGTLCFMFGSDPRLSDNNARYRRCVTRYVTRRDTTRVTTADTTSTSGRRSS